mmetsp:Transcript_6948/g.17542  ORF Transcript_6948/g.17542 Transcript_6948/m.17542 type:complete len:384 (-) Transcript_6948:275-1426(-)|eukprot:CAMPEP_0177648580 /NCGR_PEP_ID=MMETSP0447-20121125/10903_1 /TAXON_ID=0 /ORGANISM="Stygamoeba regulata, Strain BSH-02190019" /LENGTH=383 /DNA_ID=CAMNT_0019151229 /DNA_START=163 /DNA_END=1314 /DNA_ORIENTATION=-
MLKTVQLLCVCVAALLACTAAAPSPLFACPSGQRLIEFSPSHRECLTVEELADYQAARPKSLGVGFIDVTRHPEHFVVAEATSCEGYPQKPAQGSILNPLLPQLNKDNIRDVIANLSTNWPNRYFNDAHGVAAANFLKEKFTAMAAAAGRTDVTVELFPHPDTQQPSVVVTLPGTSKKDQVVVLGAHEDSVSNAGHGDSMDAPGADDDASGVGNLVEVARVLLSSEFKPARTLKFMTYAGEEGGLLGSQDIAAKYKKEGVDVFAVLQIEMSGFLAAAVADAPKTVIINDSGVSPCLVPFLQELSKAYDTVPFKLQQCEYGCSDHVSWTKHGYAAACIAEAGPFDPNLNPNMHHTGDTLDILNMDFSLHFARLALAFGVELANA